tara:strand:- start:80 stop:379 length:300 start_codon:yes stop_codon:yes gene_type:complete
LLLAGFASYADPTRPAIGYQQQSAASDLAASAANPLKLQMIQQGLQGKTATINGRLLQLGDEYQGYTLTRINIAEVVLSRGDEQRILQLHNKTIKNYEK